MESEFGKGLVVCLVKFAEHRWRWQVDKGSWQEMRLKNPELFTLSNAVSAHFNAASDHLYEIEVPKEWQNTELEKKIQELQNSGLEMGHGFSGKQWTEDDVEKAYELCQEIALLIDERLGLQSQKGMW